MSFYQKLLAGFAIAAFVAPVFAVETSTKNNNTSNELIDTSAIEITENGIKVGGKETTLAANDQTKSTDNTTVTKKQTLTGDNEAISNDNSQTKVNSTKSTDNTTVTKKQVLTETKLNINKATPQELTKVKGLNPSKVKAIITYRKNHGNFKSLDELAQVKGFKRIKKEELKQIKDQFTL